HAFHGHICLLAGLASASTAAVTTIVAAPTEAEQADAVPASGASMLISMLADTDAAMRVAAAQAIIDAYRQHVQW
ncbi:hypothetical protein V8C86DRAFT_2941474, partial [Haematococcus lacustris]